MTEATENALQRLVSTDGYLFTAQVNERSLSHRFAMFLQIEVNDWREEWHVDCEYNRDISRGKGYPEKLRLSDEDTQSLEPDIEDLDAQTVFPDVVLHRRGVRGEDGGNLLVVEFKKNTSGPDARNFDKMKKLPAFRKELKYRYAAFVLLICRRGPAYKLEWIPPRLELDSTSKCLNFLR